MILPLKTPNLLINFLQGREDLKFWLRIKICPRKVRDKEHSAEQKVTKCHVLREEDVNELFE